MLWQHLRIPGCIVFSTTKMPGQMIFWRPTCGPYLLHRQCFLHVSKFMFIGVVPVWRAMSCLQVTSFKHEGNAIQSDGQLFTAIAYGSKSLHWQIFNSEAYPGAVLKPRTIGYSPCLAEGFFLNIGNNSCAFDLGVVS